VVPIPGSLTPGITIPLQALVGKAPEPKAEQTNLLLVTIE